MRIGGWLFLIAVGAILKWAITDKVKHIDLGMVGVILMIVGLIGLVAEAIWWASRRRTTVVQAAAPPVVEQPVVRDPRY